MESFGVSDLGENFDRNPWLLCFFREEKERQNENFGEFWGVSDFRLKMFVKRKLCFSLRVVGILVKKLRLAILRLMFGRWKDFEFEKNLENIPAPSCFSLELPL